MAGAISTEDGLVPTLPLLAAAKLAGHDVGSQNADLAERLWDALDLPGDPETRHLINFAGPPEEGFRPVSASVLLAEDIPPGFFRSLHGSSVYIGSYLSDGGDGYLTPLSLQWCEYAPEEPMRGVEVLANCGATWGALGSFRSLRGAGAGALVLGLALLLAIVSSRLRFWPGLLLLALAFGSYFLLSVLTLVGVRWELPLLSPLVAIGLLAVMQVPLRFALALRAADAERRERERAVAAERAQREAMDRARDDALRMVAHDLGNPAAAMQMTVDALRDVGEELSAADRSGLLTRLRSLGQRIGRLAADLGDLGRARLPQPQLSPVDLLALVRETVEGYRLGQPGHTVSLEAPEALPRLLGDRNDIARVLGNLLDNAFRYSRTGTEVTVRVTDRGDTIRTSVTDQGIGVSAEDIPRLFGRYYRADNAREFTEDGTGIGLFSVKRLVEAHGGRVGVESTLGEGSTFWFELPRRAADAGHDAGP
jgi:signal transduction histidine kinase